MITVRRGRTQTETKKTWISKEEKAETKNILLLMKDNPPPRPQ